MAPAGFAFGVLIFAFIRSRTGLECVFLALTGVLNMAVILCMFWSFSLGRALGRARGFSCRWSGWGWVDCLQGCPWQYWWRRAESARPGRLSEVFAKSGALCYDMRRL